MAFHYDGLVVRLNSVQHLMDSLGGLERMVVDRWAGRGGLGRLLGSGLGAALPGRSWRRASFQTGVAGCGPPPAAPASRRWDDGRPRSAKARDGKSAYDWIAGMFDGARAAAARTRDHLARFIAVRVRGAGCTWLAASCLAGCTWLACRLRFFPKQRGGGLPLPNPPVECASPRGPI